MHICYIDDSGNKHGATMTGLIVPAAEWNRSLDRWLQARRNAHKTFGLPKTEELHANQLLGRREYRDYPKLETEGARRSLYRMLLNSLPGGGVEVLSCGSSSTSKPEVYRCMLVTLDQWALQRDTYVLAFYDGQQLGDATKETDDKLLRDAAPYRDIHREQPIETRRVIEDVITQDSRYSQFMQAADLLAYGIWHRDVREHPERWGDAGTRRAHKPTVAEFDKVASKFEAALHPLRWHDL